MKKIDRIDKTAMDLLVAIHSDIKMFTQIAEVASDMDAACTYCYSAAIRLENARQHYIETGVLKE